MSIDQIVVVDPDIIVLNDVDSLKESFACCATAASLSRGKIKLYHHDLNHMYDNVKKSIDDRILDYNFDKYASQERYEEAELLIRKLLIQDPPHLSVLDHGGMINCIIRCSRIASHEIVRHRIGIGITQQSTRYCREKGHVTFIRPPHESNYNGTNYEIYRYEDLHSYPTWIRTLFVSIRAYDEKIKAGGTRESSRYLLPHALGVLMMKSFNYTAIRHFVRLRGNIHAAPEIRFIAYKIWDFVCRYISKSIFTGIEDPILPSEYTVDKFNRDVGV